MKKLLKLVGLLLAVVVITMAVLAVSNICPPQGPWPAPPWCPGSTIPWPFSDPVPAADPVSEIVEEPNSEDSADTAPVEEGFNDSISENERLARVAIGLVQDLTTVNTYFNDAGSSLGEINASHYTDGLLLAYRCSAKEMAPYLPGINLLQTAGQIPAGFLDPLPESGFIPAPEGACAAGASPSASFLNEKGELITPELLAAKDIQVIDFDTLTGGSVDGRELQNTITSLITPGDQALATPAGWNEKVWSQMTQYQTPAESLMDYYLWSVSDDIEAAVVDSMSATLESMGLPSMVVNAFNNSQTSGWYAGSPPEETDKIAAMEIEAIFSGKTEGTIYEHRDFSLPNLGEMPQFGPMNGEGSVVYHDPDFGDYPFDLDIEWTKWDELGRVTEGTIIFTDDEHGAVIEMEIFENNSREAHVFRDGVEVGIVYVDVNGETTYEDLTE